MRAKSPTHSSDLHSFLDAVRQICKKFNTESDLRYITHRSTEPIIATIEALCNEILNSYLDHGIYLQKELHFDVFRYLVYYFTNFKERSFLCKDNELTFISPYLLIEILWQLHYDGVLAENILLLPVDTCAEILELLPRCILMLDFDRALKLTTTTVVNTYRKLNILECEGSPSTDIVLGTRRMMDNLCELFDLFDSERFLKFEGLKELEVHKRKGIIIKALAHMSIKCFTSNASENHPKYQMYPFKHCDKLAPDCLQKHHENVHNLLIDVMLRKVQDVDCNCYLDWTEFNDEEQPDWTLQRAISIESHRFLQHSKGKLSGKSYELLAQSLREIASTAPTEEEMRAAEKRVSDTSLVYDELLQDFLKVLLSRSGDTSLKNCYEDSIFLENARHIRKAISKFDIGSLLQFIRVYLPQVLGECEWHLTELAFEYYPMEVCEHEFLYLDEDDPLNLLFKDPERLNERDCKNFLIQLFFRPTETITRIAKFAIGHDKFYFVNLSFENIDLIIDVLKTPVDSDYSDMLQSLMKMAEVDDEEKADITKYHEARPVVPLIVQILQKIAIDDFSSFYPNLSICLKALVDKDIASVELLVEEFLLPLLLLPPINALEPVLIHMQTLVKVYKPSNGMYHRLLVRLLDKLPYDRHTERYHVSGLLGRVQDLLERVFNEPADETISLKYRRLLYAFKSKFSPIVDKDYSDEQIGRDLLRHELLYAPLWQCRMYIKDLIASHGRSLGLSCKNKAEVFDMVIQTTFEACLFGLEFRHDFPPKTAISILLLLIIELSLAKKDMFAEVGRSLSRHRVILTDVMKNSQLNEHYEKLMNDWQILLGSKEERAVRDGVRSIEKFVDEADDNLLVTESDIKSPLAVKLYAAEKIIEYLDSRNVAALLNDKFEKTFVVD